MAITLWTDQQTAKVQRQKQVRADRALEVATFGAVLLAEEGRPDLAANVAEEHAAEVHRQRALATKHNRSAGIHARPQPPPLHGRTVWTLPRNLSYAIAIPHGGHRSPCVWWPIAKLLISLWFKIRHNLAAATTSRLLCEVRKSVALTTFCPHRELS